MTAGRPLQPLSWVVVVWVCVVYLMALSGAPNGNPKTACLGSLCAAVGSSVGTQVLVIGLVTLLLLLYGGLLWVGVAGAIVSRFHWLYFLGQAGLLLAVEWAVRQEAVVLSLALALTLVAISMLKRARSIVLVAGGVLILYVVSSLTSSGAGVIEGWRALWPTFIALFWTKTYDSALIMFVVGYLVLYRQQTRAHAALAAAHQELEAANRQLRASAEQVEALSRVAERQRLARELHDTLAQGLAGVVMQLQVADSYYGEQQYGPGHMTGYVFGKLRVSTSPLTC